MISGTLFALGLVGLLLDGGVERWFSGPGLIGLAGAFAVLYGAVLLWTIWFYKGR